MLMKNKIGQMLSFTYPKIRLAIIELTVKNVTKLAIILHPFFLYPVVLAPKLEVHHKKQNIVKLIANQDH